MRQLGQLASHLCFAYSINEVPVLLNLLSSHLFVHPSGRLIVVEECHKTTKCGLTENILFHPGKQRIPGFISGPISLGTCKIILVKPIGELYKAYDRRGGHCVYLIVNCSYIVMLLRFS